MLLTRNARGITIPPTLLEFLSELKDQIKKEVSEAIKTEIKKREELASTVSLKASEFFGM